MRCLDDNDIAWLTSEAPTSDERAPFTAHLDGCASCRALMVEALCLDGHVAPIPVKTGDKVGRYLVLETIGAGAMGVVYAAYDPQLSRKIALKVLHADPVREGRHEEHSARLLREAQALARLAHPHVVTVHDVGLNDEQVFLAMEFIEGGTLREWLATRRPWRDVVSLIAQAGEGLVAAHEVHLIHRDLKPENVVIDARGRARLTDFGLAREQAPGTEDLVVLETLPVDTLTATGALVGTPAYMAPEQLRGESATELSDQFAFTAMLYEALAGERPFKGKTVAELLAATGRPLTVPPGLPTWLGRVLTRGLSLAPADRFPSMKALLHALRVGSARRPWLPWVSLAAGAILVGTLSVLVMQQRAQCSGGPDAWSTAWADGDAQRLATAFAKSGLSDSSDRATRTTKLLDAARQRWLSTWTQVCRASQVRHEQSEALLDVRLQCLADRRNEVAALARELTAGPELVDRAVSAVLSLPAVESCATVRGGAEMGTASPEVLERLSATLGQVRVLTYVARFDDAAALLGPALEEARFAKLPAHTARLMIYEARLLDHKNDLVGAQRLLHEAAALAEEARDDATAADAWTLLIRLTGRDLGHTTEARTWARYADSAIRRAGGDIEREAMRLRQLGLVVSRIEGNLDEGLDLAQRARSTFDALEQDERREFHHLLCDEVIAGSWFDLGRVDEALALHREIAASQLRIFGPQHPGFSTAWVNIGEDLATLGKPDEALPWLQRALALVHEKGEPDGYFRHRLAFAYRKQGALELALAEDQKALEALKAEGSSPYWISWALEGEGLDLLALGRAKEAVVPLEEAVQAREKEGPPADLVDALASLGDARWALGDHPGARSLVQRALDTITPLATRTHVASYVERERGLERWLSAHP